MTFAGRIRQMLHRDPAAPGGPLLDVDAFIADRSPAAHGPAELERIEQDALSGVDRDEVARETDAAAARWRDEQRHRARRSS